MHKQGPQAVAWPNLGEQHSPGPEFCATKVNALGLDLGLEGLTLPLALTSSPNSYPYQT